MKKSGILEFRGGLMLISSECSTLGSAFQEEYNLPLLPTQTVHVKAAKMGHHMLTLNPEWSIPIIEGFFKS
jgi:proline iminopeptidase